MKRILLAIALTLPTAISAQQINDVQLRPGSSALWGAAFNVNNNQDIAQYNTAGSVVDSFRFFQGASPPSASLLFSMGPTGSVVGAATGGRMGAGTLNAQGLFVNGTPVGGGGGGTPGGAAGSIQYNNAGNFGGFVASGDATINTASGALTLATVNANVGTWGSATLCSAFNVNAKGLITAAAQSTCTPDIGAITGLGTGIAAALATNVGSAGAPVLFNGAAGTPTSLVGTNITGTAAGLTAGTASAVAIGGITGAGAGCITWLTTPTSANLRGCLTDEVGTGAAYFVGGALGTPASGTATNLTGLPIATGVSGLGAGVATWLATASSANLRSALTDETGTGLAYFQGGDIGTPSAGVGTNLTALNAANLSTGNLAIARFNSGTGASSSTYWRGDGTWATPAGGGNVTGPGSSTDLGLVTWNGATGTLLRTNANAVMDASGNITTIGQLSGAQVAGAMVATQAQMETASATNLTVSPGRQHYHPSAAKVWGLITISGGVATLAAGYGINTVVWVVAGQVRVNLLVGFSSINYACTATIDGSAYFANVIRANAGAFDIQSRNPLTAALAEPVAYAFTCFGDYT